MAERLTLTIPEVAEALGISERLTATLVKDKVIPSVKLGGRRVIPEGAFLRWFEQATEGGNLPYDSDTGDGDGVLADDGAAGEESPPPPEDRQALTAVPA